MIGLFEMDHTGHGIDHAVIGWIPLLSFLVAVTGSVVGLACARQAQYATDERARTRWQLLASVSIGGVAIWLMHFIAMLGMSVPGSVVRFDLTLTILSALLAIGATFVALRIVGREVRPLRLIAGGIVLGLAVNLMHYVGMFAMRIQGTVTYNPVLVLASVAIALVAGTAALWFTIVMRSRLWRFIAAIIMGVAVVGMHYTGMMAMMAMVDPSAPVPSGLEVFDFLFPVFVVGLSALAVPMVAVLMAPPVELAPVVRGREELPTPA